MTKEYDPRDHFTEEELWFMRARALREAEKRADAMFPDDYRFPEPGMDKDRWIMRRAHQLYRRMAYPDG